MNVRLDWGLLFFFVLCSPQFLLGDTLGKITWTGSFLEPIDQIPTDRMKFGYITVPEDYIKPEGRLLQVAFILIKAAKPDKSRKDATMFFMGGWGARTLKNLPFYKNSFLSSRNDLILYDYRGTGYSKPKLCGELGSQVMGNFIANHSYATFESKQKAYFDDCLDKLEQQGIDFNQYGTDNKARDGVVLAKALAYEEYNLFGVSYGTKAIFQFIRQSEVKIRSVILDSNCPLDFPINSGMTEDYAKSLNHILEDCENDPFCQKKYPDLRENLERFLLSLDEKPLKVKLPQGRMAFLNKQEVNGIIHQLLYQEGNYSTMPFLLHKLSQGNKSVLQRILSSLEEVLVDNYNGVGLINYVYDHKPFQEKA